MLVSGYRYKIHAVRAQNVPGGIHDLGTHFGLRPVRFGGQLDFSSTHKDRGTCRKAEKP
jgi:hypothetical protein